MLIAIALPLGLFITAAVRYWRTMYGAQGYFTQTLPASAATVFGAKTLWLTIMSLCSLAVGIVAFNWLIATRSWVEIAAERRHSWTVGEALGEIMTGFVEGLHSISGWVFWMSIVVLLMGVLQSVVLMIFTADISNRGAFAAMSPGAGFAMAAVVVYIVYQAIMLILLFAIPGTIILEAFPDGSLDVAFDPRFFWINGFNLDAFSDTKLEYSGHAPLGILLAPIGLIVMYLVTFRLFSRRLNLR